MEILSAGIMAPSGKNRKPWRFVIVRNREAIKNIARQVTYSRFIRNAPQMILIYAEVNSSYPFEKDLIGIGACIEREFKILVQEQFRRDDEIIVLPLTVRVVRKTKQHEGEDVYDEGISYNVLKIFNL